jgi:hypothetical protein
MKVLPKAVANCTCSRFNDNFQGRSITLLYLFNYTLDRLYLIIQPARNNKQLGETYAYNIIQYIIFFWKPSPRVVKKMQIPAIL